MSSYDLQHKRSLVEPLYKGLSITRQCGLLDLARSSYYYYGAGESEENLHLMRVLDEQYTKTPFYGVEKMTAWLKTQDHDVNVKRVRRLMRLMALEAIYPKPRLSQKAAEHKIYPYLLREVPIVRPNQVWGADITYIRLLHGFIYLVAIMDWFSRYVLSWAISVTLDVEFCLEALEKALRRYDAPEIFNSDQGSQFTSKDFTGRLEEEAVKISMDGRGRVFDNIFNERLWRTVKYEDVYLKDYRTVPQAKDGLKNYFGFYNVERLHEALDYKTPALIYAGA